MPAHSAVKKSRYTYVNFNVFQGLVVGCWHRKNFASGTEGEGHLEIKEKMESSGKSPLEYRCHVSSFCRIARGPWRFYKLPCAAPRPAGARPQLA